ncbi:hypothetical protein ADIARSV_0554 [Arcticibacter svalbardensis MN12-7]|uniref:Resolvase/invertase-type recombinase catalytic domain-containing protein n=1 Tax=Arcticibacter svalbardensis MN12-7 TaxID=1150600 RepID=R9H564_9SPHI|nr:hypothetical protein ADIARSV_0554 [Arcticibacter svalbardensis MN12-7]
MKKTFGYASFSSLEQHLPTQIDALHKAACDVILNITV